jgi:hypothetical protein
MRSHRFTAAVSTFVGIKDGAKLTHSLLAPIRASYRVISFGEGLVLKLVLDRGSSPFLWTQLV